MNAMSFHDFSQYLSRLEATAARLELTQILAELFGQLDTTELREACYLLQGRLTPEYESLEFQMSAKMVLRAIARTHWVSTTSQAQTETLFGENDASQMEAAVRERYKQLGDVGAVIAEYITASAQQPVREISIAEAYQALRNIAESSGAGSQEEKVSQLAEVFDSSSPTAAKYLARIVIGSLRLGFATMTMLDALSWAVAGDKSVSKQLEEAYQKKADIGRLAETFLAPGDVQARLARLEEYQVQSGIPLIPQLCQRLNTAEEIIEKMGEVIAEPKYDGLRVQIHLLAPVGEGTSTVKVFTRSLDDVSHMFPELEQLSAVVGETTIILDAEAVGYDSESGQLLPFQQTITRRRKHDISETAAKVPLKFFIFDIMYYQNRSLIEEKLQDRKDLLINLFKESEVFLPTEELRTTDPKQLQTYHEAQLAAGLEGVVVKQPNAPYQSGRKSWYWVKIKEKAGTRGKLSDTIDCVVMGYYVGRGKRAQFGLGAFLVGVKNADQDFLTLAKIGTGLSEAQLGEMKDRCDVLQVSEKPKEYQVAKGLEPDVWSSPELVVEIAADELTKSPMHSARWALRFPRLIRFRDDKKSQDATTLQEIEQMAAATLSSAQQQTSGTLSGKSNEKSATGSTKTAATMTTAKNKEQS
ncbi:MAG: ATP-dependent DNA ligase [Patescibacteria group bacterium]